VVEPRALVVVGKHDLDLGAGRGIAVELRLDLFGLVRLRPFGRLVEEADSHGRKFLLVIERQALILARHPEVRVAQAVACPRASKDAAPMCGQIRAVALRGSHTAKWLRARTSGGRSEIDRGRWQASPEDLLINLLVARGAGVDILWTH